MGSDKDEIRHDSAAAARVSRDFEREQRRAGNGQASTGDNKRGTGQGQRAREK